MISENELKAQLYLTFANVFDTATLNAAIKIQIKYFPDDVEKLADNKRNEINFKLERRNFKNKYLEKFNSKMKPNDLKRIRNELNLSTVGLSELSGISTTRISKMENGKCPIYQDVADIFNGLKKDV